MLSFFWFNCSSYTTKNLYKKKFKIQLYMQKNDMDSNESAGAKSETPNHAFAPTMTIREWGGETTLLIVYAVGFSKLP
jgi:hypothetical protein